MVQVNFPSYGTITVSLPTVADLTSFPPRNLVEGLHAIVSGGTTVGDGLGGIFTWSGRSTLDADGVSTIALPSLATGRWIKTVKSGEVSTLALGAAIDTRATTDLSNVPCIRSATASFEGGDPALQIRPMTVVNTAPTALDAADFTILRREPSGGTPGSTSNALRVILVTAPDSANFAWSTLSVLENYASGGENCAYYAQANKWGSGHTWAGVFEAIDKTAVANPTKGMLGLEVDIRANASDDSDNRVGIDVVGSRPLVNGSPQGAAMQTGFAFRAQNGGDALAVFKRGYGFATGTKVVTAIDTSNAVVSGDAIKLSGGQTIAFDADSQHRFLYNPGGGLDYNVSGGLTIRLGQDGTLRKKVLSVSNLGAPDAGKTAFVGNSSVVASGNFGAIVAGGGANVVPVWADGTYWRIG